MAVIIFKALEYCNSNCMYCHVIEHDQGHTMDYNGLQTIFIRMNEYLEEFKDKNIQFTWHGGEACLLGAEYFKTALNYQNTICKNTKDRIEHLIQSNLTCITQEILDVFKELGIKSIGSSYDPLDGIRGIGKNRDSKLYKKLFFEGVQLLEKNNIPWGVTYVVHKKSLKDPEGILNHLLNLNLNAIPSFNCIYLYDGDEHGLGITPVEYADFLGALVPVYLKNRSRLRGLKPIGMFIEHILGQSGLVCDYSGACANNWLYIGPTGELSHCGRSGDLRNIDYGNIKTSSIKNALNHVDRKKIVERSSVLLDNECKDCRYWGLCHGGCPVDALSVTGNIQNKAFSCEMIKHLMSKYIEPLTGVKVELYSKI